MAASAQIDLRFRDRIPNQNAHVTKSSVRHDYPTPWPFFRVLDAEFHFTLDVCADAANAKCDRFFTMQQNGLAQPWLGETAFMNPPYGEDLPRWMIKAHSEANGGATVVCLVPARTHTKWFHRLTPDGEVRILRGRLRFDGMDSEAPFGQLVIIFRPHFTGLKGMFLWEWRARSKQDALLFNGESQ